LLFWAKFAATNLRGLLFCFFVVSAIVLDVIAYTIPPQLPNPLVTLSPFSLFIHPFPDFFGIYSHLPSCCWNQIIYFDGIWIPPLSIWCVIFAACTRLSARRILLISVAILELDFYFWVLVVIAEGGHVPFLPLASLYAVVFSAPIAFFGSREFFFLALLVIVTFCSYWVFRRIPRVLQTITAALIPLPSMIWLWDRSDWTVHFTTPIVATFTPWFTNEFLFYGCLVVFSLVTIYDTLRPRYLNHVTATRGVGNRQKP
jgi:hypothetical protein